MLKYFNAEAKIAYDLKAHLHYLNRQNHKLRNTIIAAPAWELHARTHNTAAAIKQEREQEKALIAMHNEILKANTTYQFKARGGGRMYFPSPVAGRELPLKPKKHATELSAYRSGALLENTSLLSPSKSPSHTDSWGWANSSQHNDESRNASRGASRGETRGETIDSRSIEVRDANQDEQGFEDSRVCSRESARPSSKKSKKIFSLNATALDHILVRKHGATGPVVFRNKRAARDPECAYDITPIEPLKGTTRLGFGKEVGMDFPLENWPKVIRERVATALSCNENAKQPFRDPKLDAKGMITSNEIYLLIVLFILDYISVV